MQCKICSNVKNNKVLVIKEMMLGLNENFNYFKCNQCHCIQIASIPDNLGKYYPSNYYSYQSKSDVPKKSFFYKLMFDYYTGYKRTIVGKILSKKIKSATFHTWFKVLAIYDRNTKILDVGCGGGELLKDLFKAGFKNSTGIDPFNKQDIIYNKSLKILRQDLLDHTEKYDLIMLHHSLEHMPFQQKTIEKIRALLNPNGQVLIRIPIVSDYLMEKFGTSVVSLDAPRHLFIHSIKSIEQLLLANKFSIEKKIYDAKPFSFMASEQYSKGISMYNDSRSYYEKNQSSIFSQEAINAYKEEIKMLNKNELSDTVCLYLKTS